MDTLECRNVAEDMPKRRRGNGRNAGDWKRRKCGGRRNGREKRERRESDKRRNG